MVLGRGVVHYNPYFRSHRALREPQSGHRLYDANFQTASKIADMMGEARWRGNMKRKRHNHSARFKAKVALAAVKWG
uniref:Uncharacterized protein n=1 Tax=Candidatus Kentrum eta TaxID=2126337 RepID=A0A450VJX4_9GAMM|nr:MAG: hypothetical protein BECKH772A_GA0070896_100872 [Candidatus Kentron sp. H]VFK05124.1 MAG: hypothetical protein BECKH772B_GA0070898_105352 [Candidatus Kentron sp. H]VFK08934.1 MAG: hypothetical protein BECKH772C_GA0070978_105622 [Candidatus Kentron sp. H]